MKLNDSKFRATIDPTAMLTYNNRNVFRDYLKLLCKNKYNIKSKLIPADTMNAL